MNSQTHTDLQDVPIVSGLFQQENKQRTANSTYPKVTVQCLNQALYFYQSSCLVDNKVLQNRHLRVAANRYG